MNEGLKSRKYVLVVVLLVIVSLALTTGLLVHFLGNPPIKSEPSSLKACSQECVFQLVESIPEGMTYPQYEPVHRRTGPTILDLIRNAEETIYIASSYWTLQTNDTYPTDPFSSQQGQEVFDALYEVGRHGKIKVKIVQNQPSYTYPDNDTQILAQTGSSLEVRSLNVSRLIGAGILHTKMWLVDSRHFYVGSANLDWRSYTQVKEMGVLVQNCSCLAEDMDKLFQVYWQLAGSTTTMPTSWSESLSTELNKEKPMSLTNNTADNNRGSVYLASSPPPFCPEGRTTDIDAILDVINSAERFVYIAVMDYLPIFMYTRPNRYWPVLDDALKTIAFNKKVTIQLLISKWKHTPWDMFFYLQLLQDFSKLSRAKVSLEVRIFEVPPKPTPPEIPYSRVNHNKYMVTDKHAYIGTSNWSGDYFVSTAGIGFVMEQPQSASGSSNSLRQQLENVFLRDWNSNYTRPLSNYTTPC